MEADEAFYAWLRNGNRMEKPTRAPSAIYDVMLECWSEKPEDRPQFMSLADRIGDMMNDSQRKYYVDLNFTNDAENKTWIASNQDYLHQMNGSDFPSVVKQSTPDRQYENIPLNIINSQNQGDYLTPNPPSKNSECTEITGVSNLAATNAAYECLNGSDSPGPVEIFSPRPPKVSCDNVPSSSITTKESAMMLNGEYKQGDGIQNAKSGFPVNGSSCGTSNLSSNYIPNGFVVPATAKTVDDVFTHNNGTSGGLMVVGFSNPNNDSDNGKGVESYLLKKGVRRLRSKNDSGMGSFDSGNFERNSSPSQLFERLSSPEVTSGRNSGESIGSSDQDQFSGIQDSRGYLQPQFLNNSSNMLSEGKAS